MPRTAKIVCRRYHDERWGKDEILKQVMGPSDNLRAPTYLLGDDYHRLWLGILCRSGEII